MPVLENYPVYQQAEATSCWACAGRSISNYLVAPGAPFASDQAFATAWFQVTHDPVNAEISTMQSASAALIDLGVHNNTDGAPLPTIEEIVEQIERQRPMLTIIGDDNPDGKPNIEYQDGHWMVIVGADQAANTITVFDPATGTLATVAYNASRYLGYQTGNFWQNTSYIGEE
ncbi:papain-like cysteine protease family protein [Agrobacterium vitis]|uniref:papain-like cysteine protease family protein n=1 Tax=Agrobacterium vitis TaxID=373 RepID=UPI003D28AEB9